MKDEPRSYWLPDGRIIFARQYNDSSVVPNWRICVRLKRGKDSSVTRFKEVNRRFYSEYECQTYMRKFAKERGLEPAY